MFTNASSSHSTSRCGPLQPFACARALLVLAAFVALALPARAQNIRPLDALARPGYPIGKIRVFPSLKIENSYDDNIFARRDGGVSDYFVSIVPRVAIESSWSRHSVSGSAYGRIDRYADVETEDSEEYGVEAHGRLDLAEQSSLAAIVRQGRRTVWRADSENSGRTDPQQLDYVRGELQYEHSLARFDLGFRGSVHEFDFVDALDADRDRLVFAASSRLSHRRPSDVSIFLEPEFKLLDYQRSTGDDGLEQDLTMLGGFVGSSFATSAIKGEVSLGVLHLAFDEISFDDETILGVRSKVTWEPTRLTRLRTKLERTLIPTDRDGASSKLRTLVSLEGRHELFRNVILRVEATYFREDFKDLGRHDDNYRVRAGADYRINRFFTLAARYTYRQRDSSTSRRKFRRNIAMLTIDIGL